jgi:hypothetical protein
MSRRPGGHATGDAPPVQHQHRMATKHELVGNRQARDAGADDHHIGRRVLRERAASGATSTSIQTDRLSSRIAFIGHSQVLTLSLQRRWATSVRSIPNFAHTAGS